ncbi:hypothetical protein OIU78_022996 [Salix suchowensis]|nr:hypothetical protein OIU78_022996 [Salix suchowensis]
MNGMSTRVKSALSDLKIKLTAAGGRLRHAFIGIGFRERTEAYDFQAELHDHMNYLDKKKNSGRDGTAFSEYFLG